MRGIYLITVLFWFALSSSASERITLFESSIDVYTNGTLRVQERIQVVSKGRDIVHGIVREFPTWYKGRFNSNYHVDCCVVSVMHNDTAVDYHIKNHSNGKKIYIGSARTRLAPGIHTFQITYTTNRQLGFFKDHDELYWNVTGTGWRLPIDQVKAVVTLPQAIPHHSIRIDGYTGKQGSADAHYNGQITKDSIIFSTTKPLKKYEGLTLVVSFAKGFVQEPVWYQHIGWLVRDNPLLSLLILLMLFLFFLYAMGYYIAHKKNRSRVVYPLYYPPEGMTPSQVGYINSMGFKPLFISADIIYLAVRGIITIEYKTDKVKNSHYTLHLKEEYEKNQALTTYDKELCAQLFAQTPFITITTQESAGIKQAIATCKKHTKKELSPYITFLTPWLYLARVGWFAVACVLFFYLYEWAFEWAVISGVLSAGAERTLKHFLLKAYTPEGRLVQDAIEGFKQYLTVAEIDRMRIVGTPPQKTPELYEQYLPYAIALGLEEQWTQQFSSIFEKLAQQGTQYTPLWYQGRLFKLGNFGTAFYTSCHTAIAAAATPPGSSSGSNRSGRSGGGGGGGGGGGW